MSGRCSCISCFLCGKRPLAMPYRMIASRLPVMPSRSRSQPGMSRSESLVPSAWISASTEYGPCRWQIEAPASIARTYSSATASIPRGVGLCGLPGYDIVESQVTVTISFCIDSLPRRIMRQGDGEPQSGFDLRLGRFLLLAVDFRVDGLAEQHDQRREPQPKHQ